MNFDNLIASITPEVFENLKRAIETGRWPDGNRLTEDQREHCMAAVIAYGQKHLPEKERVGYIDRGEKEEGEVCGDEHTEQPIKFVTEKKPLTH